MPIPDCSTSRSFRSVTETIECLPYIIRSGRALFGNRHYRIGPGTIGTRTSPFCAIDITVRKAMLECVEWSISL